MPDIDKVLVHWHGLPDAGAVSVLYYESGFSDTNVSHARSLFFNLAAYWPIGVTISVDPFGTSYNSETGAPTGTWVATPVATVAGAGVDRYFSGTGACVIWNTNTVVGRRRLRGRTFLVPMVNINETDGTIQAAKLAIIVGVVAAFLAASENRLQVWHRPVNEAGGIIAKAQGANIHDRPAFLSSRRNA